MKKKILITLIVLFPILNALAQVEATDKEKEIESRNLILKAAHGTIRALKYGKDWQRENRHCSKKSKRLRVANAFHGLATMPFVTYVSINEGILMYLMQSPDVERPNGQIVSMPGILIGMPPVLFLEALSHIVKPKGIDLEDPEIRDEILNQMYPSYVRKRHEQKKLLKEISTGKFTGPATI